MFIIDLVTNEELSLINALKKRKGYKVLLNPAEYFIYKTAKEQNVDMGIIWDDLSCADEYVVYVRLGDFISEFFYYYAKSMENTEKVQKLLESADIVSEIPFTEFETKNMYFVYYNTFHDIDEIAINNELSIEFSVRENYSLDDIKNILDDRLQVELHCFEDDDLYYKYVDEDKHSLYKKAEEVIWNVAYDLDKEKFIEKAFDIEMIKRRISNTIDEIMLSLDRYGYVFYSNNHDKQCFYCNTYDEVHEDYDIVIKKLTENYQKRKAFYKVSCLCDTLIGLAVGSDKLKNLLDYYQELVQFYGTKKDFMKQLKIERLRI